MSAPDTDLAKQERRHKPALILLRGVIVFAVVALIWFLFSQLDKDPVVGFVNAPESATGTPVQ